ncbi:MAG: type II toxin-antitoxin system VapC family toxin [Kiritimatiellae bacterium]|nr:type II toxin-antitoxin system VapC family toxin [Kiritimatiellia bacterium]
MTWVVDTCVLIDILKADPTFSIMSSQAIQSKMDDVLAIAPITYVELAPAFSGDVAAQDAFLSALWIQCDFEGSKEAVLAAHRSWYEHILRKRSGAEEKRPIADVMIGAYALSRGGLITRNEADFRALFPTLEIFNPTKMGTNPVSPR